MTFFFADMLEALQALEDDVPRRLPLALAAVPLRKRRKAWLAVLPPRCLFLSLLSLFFFILPGLRCCLLVFSQGSSKALLRLCYSVKALLRLH